MKKNLTLFLVVLLLGCEKDEIQVNQQDTASGRDYFASKEEIFFLASKVISATGTNDYAEGKSTFDDANIESITEIPDEKNQTLFYIVNYTDNGFIIMPADKRVISVLAYSGEEKFPVRQITDFSCGLAVWFKETTDFLTLVRDSSIKQTSEVARSWSECGIQLIANPNLRMSCQTFEIGDGDGSDDEFPCDSEMISTVSPLISTRWGQAGSFNDEFYENMNCSQDNWGQPQAGCVAVSMAQLMKFHAYPQSYNGSYYNWTAMDDVGASVAISPMLYDVALAVNTDFGCSESSSTDAETVSSLRDDFGYAPSIVLQSYDSDIVRAKINFNLPVILSANNTATTGHSWIADGYQWIDLCQSRDLLLIHMNWGWYGNANGFYRDYDFSPLDYNYSSDKKMIINIRPNN